MGTRLNGRQWEFVNAYTGGPDGVRGNATKAAAAAGYRQTHVHGARLLANARVSAAIRDRQEEAAAAARVSLEEYVALCLEHAQWWKEHDERPDPSSVKALELAGRALGFVDPATRDTASAGGVVPVELLPRRVALMEIAPVPSGATDGPQQSTRSAAQKRPH